MKDTQNIQDDPVGALTKRLARIPMRCVNCRMTTDEGDACNCPEAQEHSWEADDVAMAREALAFAREQLSTREAVADHVVSGIDDGYDTHEDLEDDARDVADAILRDLRRRLGGA